MSRLFTIFFFLSIVAIGKAQDGVHHFYFRAGSVYKQAGQASVGLDFSSRYHSAYELDFTYYRGGDNYENYLLGLNYKAVIVRNKNTNFRFRIGAFGGTDLKTFIAAPNLGFELIQSLSGKVDLIFTNNNGHYFSANAGQRWRIAAEIGLRFPF